jgi:hypothetical protein
MTISNALRVGCLKIESGIRTAMLAPDAVIRRQRV